MPYICQRCAGFRDPLPNQNACHCDDPEFPAGWVRDAREKAAAKLYEKPKITCRKCGWNFGDDGCQNERCANSATKRATAAPKLFAGSQIEIDPRLKPDEFAFEFPDGRRKNFRLKPSDLQSTSSDTSKEDQKGRLRSDVMKLVHDVAEILIAIEKRLKEV